MEKGLEVFLNALRLDVQAAVLASAAAKLAATRDLSEADMKDWAKACGLQPSFFARCVRKAAKAGGHHKQAKMAMLDVNLRQDVYEKLEFLCQKHDWDVSTYLRSLFFFYLSSTKEPPHVTLTRKRGRLGQGESRVPAERVHIRVPTVIRTALAMRARARKIGVQNLMRSLIAMAVTGNWEQPERLMAYHECAVPLGSFFLPKALVGEPVSVEP